MSSKNYSVIGDAFVSLTRWKEQRAQRSHIESNLQAEICEISLTG
ncbi:hypothetical protein VB713_27035 [Anabaena cylindrica UHCC 0172]|nr:hypothetical protein [Anabaena cylindrica]MEA5554588.1 hypothetical protein [Anabaena cylindrica UHCC 0172]